MHIGKMRWPMALFLTGFLLVPGVYAQEFLGQADEMDFSFEDTQEPVPEEVITWEAPQETIIVPPEVILPNGDEAPQQEEPVMTPGGENLSGEVPPEEGEEQREEKEEKEEGISEEEATVPQEKSEEEADSSKDAEKEADSSQEVREEEAPSIEELLSGSCGGGLTFRIGDQVLAIEGNGPMEDYSFRFAQESGTYFSTAPWDAYKEEILSIQVGEGVTSIGTNAFADFVNLGYVALPDTLVSIGGGAFAGCLSLDEIDIPDGVMEVGRAAFSRCRNLSTVVLPESLSMVSWEAFLGCISLRSIQIPESVWCVDGNAFRGCVSLKDVSLPEGLMEIGQNAFSMTGLETVLLPKSLVMFGGNVFSGCEGLLLQVYAGSAGEAYAKDALLPYEVVDVPGGEEGQVALEEEQSDEEPVVTKAPKGYLTLNKTKQILFTSGSTYNREFFLEATCVGLSGTVKYKSSDKSVCTVNSDGLVQAKGTGKAKITAYLEEDGEVYKAKCKVVVKRGKILLGQESLTLYSGDSLGIIATAQPSGKISYESKDRSVARVSSTGVVTGVTPGKTKIILRCNGITDSIPVEVR